MTCGKVSGGKVMAASKNLVKEGRWKYKTSASVKGSVDGTIVQHHALTFVSVKGSNMIMDEVGYFF
jgi:hypothetical protein